MTKEKIKEAKNFAITAIVFAFIMSALSIFMVYKGKSADIIPICAGALFAVGFTILPKAIRAERELKSEE